MPNLPRWAEDMARQVPEAYREAAAVAIVRGVEGNVVRAAATLGVSERTVRRRTNEMRRYVRRLERGPG